MIDWLRWCDKFDNINILLMTWRSKEIVNYLDFYEKLTAGQILLFFGSWKPKKLPQSMVNSCPPRQLLRNTHQTKNYASSQQEQQVCLLAMTGQLQGCFSQRNRNARTCNKLKAVSFALSCIFVSARYCNKLHH